MKTAFEAGAEAGAEVLGLRSRRVLFFAGVLTVGPSTSQM